MAGANAEKVWVLGGSSDNPVPVDPVGPATTTLGQGVKVVASAGTAERLSASSVPVLWVAITAQTDNTGLIAVGGVGVDATVATGNGTPLNAGDSMVIEFVNLTNIYIDATVSGDGVRYSYGT